jgi:hypothetical protein
LIEIFLYFEKHIKNIKNINATIINLRERDIKGLALSTIILLVIKAEDHKITKVRGIKLKMKITLYL